MPRAALPSLLLAVACVPPQERTSQVEEDPSAACTEDAAFGGCIEEILAVKCNDCHGRTRTGAARNAAPEGVDFDTEALVIRWAERIRVRAVETLTMPPDVPLTARQRGFLSTYLSRHLGCQAACDGRACGDDGCGGSCGTCDAGLTCDTRAGACVQTCQVDCATRVCGDDGCGGSCGTCGDGEACDELQGQCVCVPSCAGRQCGEDGCGGRCGECGDVACVDGRCQYPEVSLSQDIMGLMATGGCNASSCHSGDRPRAGLGLDDAATLRSQTIGVASVQCSGKILIAPGEPAGSYLLNKLTGEGMCAGELMPKGGRAFTDTQIDTVRAWIGNGAPDN